MKTCTGYYFTAFYCDIAIVIFNVARLFYKQAKYDERSIISR